MKDVIVKKINNTREAEDFAAALKSLKNRENQNFAVIEWRSEMYCADKSDVSTGEIDEVALILKSAAKRIIFTFRTEHEADNIEAMKRKYYNILYKAAETQNIDYLDIEIDGLLEEAELIHIIKRAKDTGKKIIASRHIYSLSSNASVATYTNSNRNLRIDEEATADGGVSISSCIENDAKDVISKAELIGADIVKIAVKIPREEEGEAFIKSASEELLRLGMQPVIIVLGEVGSKLRRKSEKYGVIWNFLAFSNEDVSDIGQEILLKEKFNI